MNLAFGRDVEADKFSSASAELPESFKQLAELVAREAVTGHRSRMEGALKAASRDYRI